MHTIGAFTDYKMVNDSYIFYSMILLNRRDA